MLERVLDTNIVSYRWKSHSLAQVYERHLQGHRIWISFMTLAELREWALTARWKKKRLDQLLDSLSAWNIFGSTHELCQCWAEIRYERRRQPINVADAWIAATAILLDCELVTHNPRDFRGIRGLKLITESTS